MPINSEKLANLFTYHPPQTSEREAKHKAVNDADIAFGEAIAAQIDSPAELTVILRRIQEVRMQANAAVCYEAEGISYRGLFDG